MEKSPWYSSIHKANEIIYLLDGKLDIKGSHENGTLVTFSYPI
jgi:two-component system sensor histidine kinase DegS